MFLGIFFRGLGIGAGIGGRREGLRVFRVRVFVLGVIGVGVFSLIRLCCGSGNEAVSISLKAS